MWINRIKHYEVRLQSFLKVQKLIDQKQSFVKMSHNQLNQFYCKMLQNQIKLFADASSSLRHYVLIIILCNVVSFKNFVNENKL